MPVFIPKNDIIQNDATRGEEEVCHFKYDKRSEVLGTDIIWELLCCRFFFSQYLQRWCLNQMWVSVDWVDRVHVCGSLAILSRWPTFLPPTCQQSMPCFFVRWPDPFCPSVSPFWANHQWHHISESKSFYCLQWLWPWCMCCSSTDLVGTQ